MEFGVPLAKTAAELLRQVFGNANPNKQTQGHISILSLKLEIFEPDAI